jgi:uncharacterized membrane protein (DUF106 family)
MAARFFSFILVTAIVLALFGRWLYVFLLDRMNKKHEMRLENKLKETENEIEFEKEKHKIKMEKLKNTQRKDLNKLRREK